MKIDVAPEDCELSPPRLLVSVRSAAEAAAAIAGGCQILDVKEPSRGSLGFAGVDAIASVAKIAAEAGIPVSAALGEAAEWTNDRRIPRTPRSLTWCKLGMAGLGGDSGWRREWDRVRARFDAERESPIAWIAVAYGDWGAAAAPHPDAIVSAAIEERCAGVLFDTWDKGGGRLSQYVDRDQLGMLTERCRVSGLLVALAGRLNDAEIAKLSGVPCDLVAVRSAACREADRNGPIDVEAVRSLRMRIGQSGWNARGRVL